MLFWFSRKDTSRTGLFDLSIGFYLFQFRQSGQLTKRWFKDGWPRPQTIGSLAETLPVQTCTLEPATYVPVMRRQIRSGGFSVLTRTCTWWTRTSIPSSKLLLYRSTLHVCGDGMNVHVVNWSESPWNEENCLLWNFLSPKPLSVI